MSGHFYAWVIRTKNKTRRGIWGETKYGYFAERTSIKNPRFVTTLHFKVRIFENKDAAETYYFAKSRAKHDTKEFKIRRLKFFTDKYGKWDYWKNREVLTK